VRLSGGHLCEAEAPTEPAGEMCKRLRQSVLSPSRHCERRKVRGNPFSLLRVLRILSRFAFRMTNRLVIAVRVSGGHLCEAEAPTEPAGEMCKRLWQSVPPCHYDKKALISAMLYGY